MFEKPFLVAFCFRTSIEMQIWENINLERMTPKYIANKLSVRMNEWNNRFELIGEAKQLDCIEQRMKEREGDSRGAVMM
jgi:hypothetical protein